MNPPVVEAQLLKAQNQFSEIRLSANADGEFNLSSDEARTLVTSMAGLSFDLRQTEKGLETELLVLEGQLNLVRGLFQRTSKLRIESVDLVTNLMRNTPPDEGA